SRAVLGIVLFCLGFTEQALAQSHTAVAEARRLAYPESLAWSLALGAVLLSLVGQNAALDEPAGQLVAVATEQGFPFYRALGTIYRGWVTVKSGDVTEGMLAAALRFRRFPRHRDGAVAALSYGPPC